MVKKFVIVGWILTLLLLFFYSFTQIDLGLTLTRISWWQTVQKNFQYIGYFKRPLSTDLYLAILFLLFTFCFLLLFWCKRNRFTSREIWLLILLTAGLLWFSYNAFSYDLFNYIFDTRIITYYQQNPYEHKALDFSGDPMLGFMHWTHRYYPYGPLWLAITVPLSFLGFHKLIPTMILFKGLGVIGYLGSSWFIYKILSKTNPSKKLFGLTFYAFNPLIIIESLVSGHNDILMMMVALGGFWFLLKKKYLPAWLMLGLSVGIKFATAVLIPVFIFVIWLNWQKRKIDWEKIWLISFFFMVVALLAAIKRTEVQPWYLLYILPFVSLVSEKPIFFWPAISLSLGLLLHYAPFLYLGNWDPPVPTIKIWLTVGFFALGLIGGLIIKNEKKTVF